MRERLAFDILHTVQIQQAMANKITSSSRIQKASAKLLCWQLLGKIDLNCLRFSILTSLQLSVLWQYGVPAINSKDSFPQNYELTSGIG